MGWLHPSKSPALPRSRACRSPRGAWIRGGVWGGSWQSCRVVPALVFREPEGAAGGLGRTPGVPPLALGDNSKGDQIAPTEPCPIPPPRHVTGESSLRPVEPRDTPRHRSSAPCAHSPCERFPPAASPEVHRFPGVCTPWAVLLRCWWSLWLGLQPLALERDFFFLGMLYLLRRSLLWVTSLSRQPARPLRSVGCGGLLCTLSERSAPSAGSARGFPGWF